MNYSRAEEFLQGLTDYEKSPSVAYGAANYDLRRVELLLELLGNPHKGMRAVHVAGTKGKGSTAAMIASVLQAAGYRTGLFTSPHLFSWRERIAINGRHITEQSFSRLVTSVEEKVRAINRESRFGKLTTFEALTAMSLLYFRQRHADFMVLETGMGGRLDATNVVNPEACIITSISLDHTQVLGNTLSLIAAEKAGIIKPGCTVISAPQPPEAAEVIKNKCRSARVKLIETGKAITWKLVKGSWKGQTANIKGLLGTYRLNVPLIGDFQLENAALAIAALEVLKAKGAKISYADMRRGIERVKWPARLQVLRRHPLVIADGAHNAYSIRKIIEAIRKHFTFGRAVVIFGASLDKDISGMAREMHGFADQVILARSSHERAAKIDDLLPIFSQAGLAVRTARDPAQALQAALVQAGRNDLILATGSLFLAADILAQIRLQMSRSGNPRR